MSHRKLPFRTLSQIMSPKLPIQWTELTPEEDKKVLYYKQDQGSIAGLLKT